jgi:hypothetical protein
MTNRERFPARGWFLLSRSPCSADACCLGAVGWVKACWLDAVGSVSLVLGFVVYDPGDGEDCPIQGIGLRVGEWRRVVDYVFRHSKDSKYWHYCPY